MTSPTPEKEVSLAVTQTRAAWVGSSCMGKALEVRVGSELVVTQQQLWQQ